jgi:tetratricopeptide (TPR) repeat protein
VHASFDWLDRIPAIAAPALAAPFIALRVAARPPAPRPARSVVRGWAPVAAVAVVSAVAAVALVVPWLAVRYEDRALARWRADPDGALADFDRAARANPLDPQPLLSKATVALRLERPQLARAAFRDALAVEEGWYAHLELALMDAHDGRFAAARRRLERASALNAHDPLLASARERIAARERIDPVAFNREVLGQTLYQRKKIA